MQLGTLLPVVGLPRVELQASFDQYGGAFAEILTGNLGRSAPQGDVDKRSFLDPLTVRPFAPIVHRQTDIAHGGAAGGVSDLGIASEVSHQDNAVETRHCLDSLRS
jgi:hypothetical protein